MTYKGWIVGSLAVVALLAGCNQAPPGRSRSLGPVQYEAAFASAREIMAQYFDIESDAVEGVVRSRPAPVEAPAERLIGHSPARQMATLRLRRKNGTVVAHLSVAIQREDSAEMRQMADQGTGYDTVPNKTPAYAEAATTTEQNQTWRTERYDHDLAAKVLDDLYAALHPEAKRPE